MVYQIYQHRKVFPFGIANLKSTLRTIAMALQIHNENFLLMISCPVFYRKSLISPLQRYNTLMYMSFGFIQSIESGLKFLSAFLKISIQWINYCDELYEISGLIQASIRNRWFCGCCVAKLKLHYHYYL